MDFNLHTACALVSWQFGVRHDWGAIEEPCRGLCSLCRLQIICRRMVCQRLWASSACTPRVRTWEPVIGDLLVPPHSTCLPKRFRLLLTSAPSLRRYIIRKVWFSFALISAQKPNFKYLCSVLEPEYSPQSRRLDTEQSVVTKVPGSMHTLEYLFRERNTRNKYGVCFCCLTTSTHQNYRRWRIINYQYFEAATESAEKIFNLQQKVNWGHGHPKDPISGLWCKGR